MSEKPKKTTYTFSDVMRSWRSGLIFIIPIAATIWILVSIVTGTLDWYLGLTSAMADAVVFDLLGLSHDNNGAVAFYLSVFHFIFIVLVLVALFLAGEILNSKYGEQISNWVHRTMAMVPVGGFVYKALRLLSKSLHHGDEEGGSLISAVCLIPSVDKVGNVQLRPGYVIGSGEMKIRNPEVSNSTNISIYFGHNPNPSSGNGTQVPKGQVILTNVPIGSFAAKNAMLGHGLDEEFQPYSNAYYDRLRALGVKLYIDLIENLPPLQPAYGP